MLYSSLDRPCCDIDFIDTHQTRWIAERRCFGQNLSRLSRDLIIGRYILKGLIALFGYDWLPVSTLRDPDWSFWHWDYIVVRSDHGRLFEAHNWSKTPQSTLLGLFRGKGFLVFFYHIYFFIGCNYVWKCGLRLVIWLEIFLDQALRTHTSEGSRIIQSRYFGLPNAFRHQNREHSLRDPLARKL